MFQTTNLCRKIDTALKTANGFATASSKPSNTSNTPCCYGNVIALSNVLSKWPLTISKLELQVMVPLTHRQPSALLPGRAQVMETRSDSVLFSEQCHLQ